MDQEVTSPEQNTQFSDGTVDGAALDIANIDLGDSAPAPALPERDDSGRFRSQTPATEEIANDDARPLTNGHDPEDEDDEPIAAQDNDEPAEEVEGDDEQDFIELPGETDDAEPVRLALQDVVEGYKRAKDLEAELTNVKTAAPPPPDYDQAVETHLNTVRELRGHIRDWQLANPIRTPDESMIDPGSPNFNPELYHAQLQHARTLHQSHQHAKQAAEAAAAEEQKHQDMLEQTRWTREQAKIFERHPGLKAESERLKLAADLEANYGIDVETLQGIRDSRAFDIIMDALAFRKAQKATKKVAKAVKAKPKLVRQKGRDGSNPKQRRAAQAMKRLGQTHDIDDAASAIGNLGIL